MKWLEHPVRYAGSELRATAIDRGVIGVVCDRAQVYCIGCGLEMEILVVGEVFQDTKYYKDANCDKCGESVLKTEQVPPGLQPPAHEQQPESSGP